VEYFTPEPEFYAARPAAIVAAARRERILSKPRRPISETNFSLRAWEALAAGGACASKPRVQAGTSAAADALN
jgi:hypothetical protein